MNKAKLPPLGFRSCGPQYTGYGSQWTSCGPQYMGYGPQHISRISQVSVSESYGPQYLGYGPQPISRFHNSVLQLCFQLVTARKGWVAARNTIRFLVFSLVLVRSAFSFRFGYYPALLNHIPYHLGPLIPYLLHCFI